MSTDPSAATDGHSAALPLYDNFRPVQPLNSRIVYKSFQRPSIHFAYHTDTKQPKNTNLDADDNAVDGNTGVRSLPGGAVITLLALVVINLIIWSVECPASVRRGADPARGQGRDNDFFLNLKYWKKKY